MVAIKVVSNTKGAIKIAGTPYAGLAKLVPSVLNNTTSIKLTDANCAIANAIRRTLISEMPVKHLTVSLTDIKTTDPYVIGEVIKKRIEMIPISQSMKEDTVFSVKVENELDTYADVLSSDIKVNGISESKHIVPFIPICDINSGTILAINDIHITESYGYSNARAVIGKVSYEILDHDMTKSANVSAPTQFLISLETPGLIDPLAQISKAIDSLIERVDSINYEDSVVEFDVFKLHIQNETYSIGKLFSWYIFKQNPTIKFVADRIIHPSKRECIIDVRHPEGKKLCEQAAEEIKTDLKTIKKGLK